MAGLADKFVEALRQLEQTRDTKPIVQLFADSAVLSNPLIMHRGEDGNAAETFWGRYVGTFDRIASDFSHVKDDGDIAFLEWSSRGSVGGKDFIYEGVSILETSGDRITAFRTYFDPQQIPTAREGNGQAGSAPAPSPGQSQSQSSGSTGSNTAAANGDGASVEGDALEKGQRDAAEQRAQGGYS